MNPLGQLDLNHSLETYAHFIVSPLFIWGFCLLMGLYCLKHLLTLTLESSKLETQLQKVLQIVKQKDDNEKFFADIQELSTQVNLLPKMKKSWGLFTGSLLPTTGQNQRRFVSQDVHEIFASEPWVNNNLDMDHYLSVGQNLTILGILGTFLGLTAGIYLAQFGIRANDLDHMQLALTQLLKGASLAFWTSMVGILLSFLYNKISKIVLNKNYSAVSSLGHILSHKTIFQDQAVLQHSQQSEQQKQCEILSKLATTNLAILESLNKLNENNDQTLIQKNMLSMQNILEHTQDQALTLLKRLSQLALNLNDKSKTTIDQWQKTLELSEQQSQRLLKTQKIMARSIDPMVDTTQNLLLTSQYSQNTVREALQLMTNLKGTDET